MGITGLIPFLEKASSKVNLRDYRGSTVAVDSYCWLHKGVYSCAEKLARGEDTDKYLQYCLRYVQLLLSHDIKPILVFDGRHLPAKVITEQRRRESRKISKKMAADLLRAGRTEEARSHMRRCIDVTHEMALKLIRECRKRSIDCIVAPYEADAQLAWLNKMNIAQYIITEDSDLTLFGATQIIFKLDLTGAGLLVQTDKLHLAMGCSSEKYTFDKFRRMCILSGCDYLDSLSGIGLAKACKFMLMTEEDDMRRALKKIPSYLNMRQLEVSESYIENFLKAEATFRHMYIYNPIERRMERLNPLDVYKTSETLCSNAGTLLENNQQAFQLALGNLNPFTLEAMDNWHPDNYTNFKNVNGVTRAKSIWDTNFKHSYNDNKYKSKNETQSQTLFFKKIDFLSQTLNKDMQESQGNTKQDEAEVVNMYLLNNQIKSSNNVNKLTNVNCTVTSKSPYNPFVKKPYENGRLSPPVVPNASLLKVLTPQKFKEKEGSLPPSPRPSPAKCINLNLNKFKRSFFQSQATTTTAKPLVKSRFFNNNLNQSLPPANSVQSTEDVNDVYKKLEEIEQSMQEQKLHLDLFYKDRSSPQKKVPRLEITKDTMPVHDIKTDTVLVISDEETHSASSPLEITSYKCKAAPRLGTKNKSTSKSKQLAVPDTQSLLSKFGFQRRTVLK